MSWDDEDDIDDCYVTCPGCAADVYDDAPSCPYCGHLDVTNSNRSAYAVHWRVVSAILLFVFLYGLIKFGATWF